MRTLLFVLFQLMVASTALADLNCPANNLVITAKPHELKDATFWSFCNNKELQFHRQNLSDLGLLTSDISKAIGKVDQSRQSLVQVPSYFFDIMNNRWTPMAGVGSIVAVLKDGNSRSLDIAKARLFVLTAHHVASGKILSVRGKDNSIVPILRTYHDFENDLSLLEIDTQKISPKPSPFAYYFAKQEVSRFFATEMEPSDGQIKNRISYEVLNITYIEGLDALMKNEIRSFVPIAPWLENKSDSSNIELPFLSRQFEQNIGLAFPKSFSGSPVVVSNKSNGFSYFELAGVLSTSEEMLKSTKATAPSSLKKLFKDALKNIATNSKGIWYLFDGNYLKLNYYSISLYLNNGPIGNGIVIDGRVIDDTWFLKQTLPAKFPQELEALKNQLINDAKYKELTTKIEPEKRIELLQLLNEKAKDYPNIEIK